MSSKAIQWLYTKKNIAGSALAVAGTAALVALGLVTPPLALVILPALYGVGALLAPSDKAEARGLASALSAVDSSSVEESLAAIQASIHGHSAPEIEAAVAGIADTLRLLLPRVSSSASAPERHELLRIATTYLPMTLAPYLSMPSLYADRAKLSDGTTAKDAVLAQLAVIKESVDASLAASINNNVSAILSNGEFLNQRLGASGIRLAGQS